MMSGFLREAGAASVLAGNGDGRRRSSALCSVPYPGSDRPTCANGRFLRRRTDGDSDRECRLSTRPLRFNGVIANDAFGATAVAQLLLRVPPL
jgi:hypothetical protein